jgi:hypothetical protein
MAGLLIASHIQKWQINEESTKKIRQKHGKHKKLMIQNIMRT